MRAMPASARAPVRPAMATYWRLNADVTVAVSAGRAVFLDIAHDRYVMLPPPLNATFIEWLGGPAGPMPEACLTALAARLGFEDEDRRPAHPVSLAIPCDVPGTMLPRVRPGLGEALGVAAAVIRARRMLRKMPLRTNLEHRRSALERPARRAANRQATAVKAAVYHAVRHLAPVRRVCLLDSLALVDWLGEDLDAVQLVFGVTAYPFGAHCWVQTRHALLGDPPDTIGRYAPILHLG